MKPIKPSRIEGRVRAPPSKSMMIRAVAAAALAGGKSSISNPSFCEDAKASMECAKALGAKVSVEGERVAVIGGGKLLSSTLKCGESGLCMRMFTPIAALFGRKITLAGAGSLAKRKMGMVAEPLGKLGAECSTTKGFPPITVQGPINGRKVQVDGSQSSQFLTGLLMALPLCKGDSVVAVSNLKSKPYVLMTLGLLSEFGVNVKANSHLSRFEIAGGQKYRACDYEVEGDWSGAAPLLVAGAIAGRVEVGGLRMDSLQADRAIVDALKKAGAKVRSIWDGVAVEHAKLHGFRFDATDCPDLFPPLAVLACACTGKSVLIGAERLKGKESNRGAALSLELGKLGARIRVKGNAMEIEGGEMHGGRVETHGDHRIAMACAIAALGCSGSVQIAGGECVAKSYPEFFEDLEMLGVG